jgi:hypothetical protein
MLALIVSLRLLQRLLLLVDSSGDSDSDSHSGHDSDHHHYAKANGPPIRIGPPKSKSKQKPVESVDVTTFVPDQGIYFILYLG